MALINKTGISNGSTIQAEHITRAIDALSGGSSDSVSITGSLMGSASYALTASYALNGGGGSSTTVDFALTASKILVADNTSLSGPQPIMLAIGTGATKLVATDTTDFSFNPIGNVLTVARISGAPTSNSASVTMTSSYAHTASYAFAIPTISITPANPVMGQIYVDPTEAGLIWVYDGTDWYKFQVELGYP